MDIGVEYTVWVVHNFRILQSTESLMSTRVKMKSRWIYDDDDVYVEFFLFFFPVDI